MSFSFVPGREDSNLPMDTLGEHSSDLALSPDYDRNYKKRALTRQTSSSVPISNIVKSSDGGSTPRVGNSGATSATPSNASTTPRRTRRQTNENGGNRTPRSNDSRNEASNVCPGAPFKPFKSFLSVRTIVVSA